MPTGLQAVRTIIGTGNPGQSGPKRVEQILKTIDATRAEWRAMGRASIPRTELEPLDEVPIPRTASKTSTTAPAPTVATNTGLGASTTTHTPSTVVQPDPARDSDVWAAVQNHESRSKTSELFGKTLLPPKPTSASRNNKVSLNFGPYARHQPHPNDNQNRAFKELLSTVHEDNVRASPPNPSSVPPTVEVSAANDESVPLPETVPYVPVSNRTTIPSKPEEADEDGIIQVKRKKAKKRKEVAIPDVVDPTSAAESVAVATSEIVLYEGEHVDELPFSVSEEASERRSKANETSSDPSGAVSAIAPSSNAAPKRRKKRKVEVTDDAVNPPPTGDSVEVGDEAGNGGGAGRGSGSLAKHFGTDDGRVFASTEEPAFTRKKRVRPKKEKVKMEDIPAFDYAGEPNLLDNPGKVKSVKEKKVNKEKKAKPGEFGLE